MSLTASRLDGVDAISRSVALAITQVQAEIQGLASTRGRAGLIAALRQRAESLAPSPIAHQQILAAALRTAADDIAWGRSPLAGWRDGFGGEGAPQARARLRERLEGAYVQDRALEDSIAAEIEALLVRQAGDAFAAARDYASSLALALQLQAGLWDEPGLPIADQTRLRMKAGEHGLRRRLTLAARPRRPVAPPPQPAAPLWRRVLRRGLW